MGVDSIQSRYTQNIPKTSAGMSASTPVSQKDRSNRRARLFNLLATPKEERADPFVQHLVGQPSEEEEYFAPHLLPEVSISRWGLWFSWTRQTPHSLLLWEFVDRLKTLPFIEENEASTLGDENVEHKVSPSMEATAGSSSTVAKIPTDKRTLVKKAAQEIDTLLAEQVHNKNSLSLKDRKADLDLIQRYQQALRAAHAAPDAVLGLSTDASPCTPRFGQPLQALLAQPSPASADHLRPSTGSKILPEENTEEVEYEIVDEEGEFSTSRRSRVQEVVDEEDPVKSPPLPSNQKGKGIAQEPPIEKNFQEAWGNLKEVALSIQAISPSEDSFIQRSCLTILNGVDRFLGFIPFVPLAVSAIKYVCYDLRKLAQEVELEKRNTVRKALIKISEDIKNAPDDDKELDMGAVDTIQSTVHDTARSLATATGEAMQKHTDHLSELSTAHISSVKQETADIKKAGIALQQNINARFDELQRAQQEALRTPSPEFVALQDALAAERAEKALLQQQLAQKDQVIAALAAALSTKHTEGNKTDAVGGSA